MRRFRWATGRDWRDSRPRSTTRIAALGAMMACVGVILAEDRDPLATDRGTSPVVLLRAIEAVDVPVQRVVMETESADESDPREAESGNERQFGQEPANVRQIFLRQSSSLVGAGRLQHDIGFTYTLQERNDLAVFLDQSIGQQRVRDRQFVIPMTWRYGIWDDLEVFATIPVGMSVFERADLDERTTEMVGGLGDVGGGFLCQLLVETADCPDVILGGTVTAPTGAAPFGPSLNIASLGRGFWTLATDVSWVKSYDPVVVFGSVGYRHEFENRFAGIRVTPGEVFTYSFGLGFSVNDDIALTAEMVGQFQSEFRFNGNAIPNTVQEPVLVRLGFTRRISRECSIQPFLSAGLTSDAPQVFAGLFFIRTQDLRSKRSCFPWDRGRRCRFANDRHSLFAL